MAEWRPLRANPAPTPPPAPLPRWEQLENAIELATYLTLEGSSGTSYHQQRDIIYTKITTDLPIISPIIILEQIGYYHHIFVAKALRSATVSSHSVAQRLLDPSDPFRLGADYLDPTTPNTQEYSPTVITYLDDIVLR